MPRLSVKGKIQQILPSMGFAPCDLSSWTDMAFITILHNSTLFGINAEYRNIDLYIC